MDNNVVVHKERNTLQCPVGITLEMKRNITKERFAFIVQLYKSKPFTKNG